jgi:NodT family efflux transporter outer membrane factor (OMF) lipoprotein
MPGNDATRHRPVRLDTRRGLAVGGFLLAFLLGGCDPGPPGTIPPPEQQADWRSAPAAPAPIWPREDWWRGFKSPELDGLIGTARVNSPDIAAAIARIRQADAQLRIAGAALLPSLGGTGNASWQQVATGSLGRSYGARAYTDLHSYSLGLNAAYEADFWGRNAATQQAALATALFSRFDRQTVALGVLTSVAGSWFNALAFSDRLAAARDNLKDAEQTLAVIRGRLDAGTASMLDVSQQEALVAGERANLPNLANQMEQALLGLSTLVGQPPAAITARPGTLATLSLPELAPGLPSELLTRRPDVASAEAQLASAHASVAAARAAFFPSIQLTASGSFQSAALATMFGPGAMLASLAGGLTQPIFDGGTLRGQLEQAKGRQEELLADYRKSVLQAFTDVESALTAYRFTTEQEGLQALAVTTARRSADIARAQLAAGTVDVTTVLTAQTTLYNAQDTLVQVRVSRFQALLSLYKAMGGGWTRADVDAPGLAPGRIQGGVALPIGSNLE